METSRDASNNFHLLSQLVLCSNGADECSRRIVDATAALTRAGFDDLLALASKNHVVVRAFTRFMELVPPQSEVAGWSAHAVDEEDVRIRQALACLNEICGTLERSGCPVTVIKSLDHWPDLGSDLDLYTDADPENVVNAMRARLQAKLEARSWGDRLANKWNFVVPGLPELVEIHVGRLGQTGEQTMVAKALSGRTRMMRVGQYSFRVLSPEDRIIISTLQRMYRHFYIRLCDVLDNANLLDARCVDFAYLHTLGSAAGLWEGIATYLTIVSGYVQGYRGYGAPLPSLVTGSAKFGSTQVQFRRDFLRVPILPHSLNLYAGELRALLFQGQLRNSLRLSLLPGLATAAALELKFTGSDKGIW